MSDLLTTYLGLTHRNPLVAASSGLTNATDKIVQPEEKGLGQRFTVFTSPILVLKHSN